MIVEILNHSTFPFNEQNTYTQCKKVILLIEEENVGFPLEAKSIALVFKDERDARALNMEYRKKDYATDVLSFSSSDPDSLGELVLCPQVIDRQSKEHNLNFEQELTYMILHGILHLLGYEHEDDLEKEREMMFLQDTVFSKIYPDLEVEINS